MHCAKIRNTIRILRGVEKYLDKMRDFEKLKPSFVLVGSIIEGTRVGGVTELDLTVTFSGLRKFPLYLERDGDDREPKDAFTLYLNDSDNEDVSFKNPLKVAFSSKDKRTSRRTFNYQKFIGELLKKINEALIKESQVESHEEGELISICYTPMGSH